MAQGDPAPKAAAEISVAAAPGDRQILEHSIESKVQSMLDEIIGKDRSVFRVIAELAPETRDQRGHPIARLSMALTVEETKVIIDPNTREELRPAAEVANLMNIVTAAAGFDADRGDFISVQTLPL
jgi:flagellar biosynthesis/type III secretory pathway M-ring protein FliF/YscJ